MGFEPMPPRISPGEQLTKKIQLGDLQKTTKPPPSFSDNTILSHNLCYVYRIFTAKIPFFYYILAQHLDTVLRMLTKHYCIVPEI